MALSAGTVYEVRSTATSGNVNSGGFNPGNTNGPADLTTNAGTGNTSSPVVSSASYNFVAGDVGAWLYVAGGTNWTPGWYQIASVAANKATLSADVGQAIQVNNNRFLANTVAGCATTGTPTGGTFMIDYSQQDSAQVSFANLGSTGSTTLTDNSSGGLFTPVMVGNLIHITAGTNFTPGWYEIITVTNTNNVVLDSSPTAGGAASAGTGTVGGAISLGATGTGIGDLSFSSLSFSTTSVQTNFFVKGNATYTPAEEVSASANWEGYSSVRGDRPTGSTRPILSMGANLFGAGPIRSFIVTGTGSTGFIPRLVSLNPNQICEFCTITCSSTTAGQIGLFAAGAGTITGCGVVCYRGTGIDVSSGWGTAIVIGNYVHDCDVGINMSPVNTLIDNIVCGCVTAAINIPSGVGTGGVCIVNNTLYGAANQLGIGIDCQNSTIASSVMNNILYGFATGVNSATATQENYSDYNDYYNNTNDVSAVTQWQKGAHDLAVDPQFANVVQLTGSTATTSGSVLTQTGADFSNVVDGQDFLYLKSGTGITAGIYGITAHTTTTLTLDIAPGTSATADKVWQVTTGRNFAVGKNLKAVGYPGLFSGGLTTGYMDIGAVQRKEPTLAATFIGG